MISTRLVDPVVEQLAQIADKLDSPWVAVSAVATLLATIVAIVGIAEVRSWIFKPRIVFQESKLHKVEQNNQKGQPFVYHRLITKNLRHLFGRAATDVRVLLTYDNGEQESLENFIPIPLQWTYFGGATRDMSQGEPVYLDVMARKKEASVYDFCWADDMSGSGSASGVLKEYNPHLGDLRLEFYERNGGRIGDMKIKYSIEGDYFQVVRSRW